MANKFSAAWQVMTAVLIGLFLSTAIPVLIGLALNIPAGITLILISSTFLLQANGVFVGLGLGLHPLVILEVMIFVELGAVLGIYRILGTFEESEKVKRFIKKADKAIEKYPILSRYGAVTLAILPALPIVGLYTSVPVGWLFRWKKVHCIVFIKAGWIVVVVFLMFLSLGVFQAFL